MNIKKILFWASVIFIILNGKVYAKTELSCIYDSNGASDYMFVQKSDGTMVFYQQDNSGASPEPSGNWEKKTGVEYSFDNTVNYQNNMLIKCPEYAAHTSGFKYIWFGDFYEKFTFYDKQNNKLDAKLFKEQNENVDNSHIPVDTNIFYSQYMEDYKKIVDETEWIAECTYYNSRNGKNVYLYFNKERYILINDSLNHNSNIINFSLEELKAYFDSTVYNCPPRLYETTNVCASADRLVFDYIYYLKKDSYNILSECAQIELNNTKNVVNVLRPEPEPEPEPIDDCKSLFGDDLVKTINKVMDWVKIIVPILLIGLGIFDFTKAIFAADEEKMKKAGKTFFNRIIAAVLVFIAPIFVNLILNLANEVWSEIKADTCISQPE